jgi:hypothetical protein
MSRQLSNPASHASMLPEDTLVFSCHCAWCCDKSVQAALNMATSGDICRLIHSKHDGGAMPRHADDCRFVQRWKAYLLRRTGSVRQCIHDFVCCARRLPGRVDAMA